MDYKNKPITLRRLLRKISSILSLLITKCRTYKYRIRFLLTGVNITFGKNVSIGRMITVRTPDDGEIVIGDNVSIGDFAMLIADQGKLKIDDNSGAGIGTHIVAINSVSIGKWCLIAPYCVIRDGNHGTELTKPMVLQEHTSEPIVIGDDVWLGSHVVITAGSHLGNGVIIGANAVVTSDIPENVIAGGVPARVIKVRGKHKKNNGIL